MNATELRNITDSAVLANNEDGMKEMEEAMARITEKSNKIINDLAEMMTKAAREGKEEATIKCGGSEFDGSGFGDEFESVLRTVENHFTNNGFRVELDYSLYDMVQVFVRW